MSDGETWWRLQEIGGGEGLTDRRPGGRYQHVTHPARPPPLLYPPSPSCITFTPGEHETWEQDQRPRRISKGVEADLGRGGGGNEGPNVFFLFFFWSSRGIFRSCGRSLWWPRPSVIYNSLTFLVAFAPRAQARASTLNVIDRNWVPHPLSLSSRFCRPPASISTPPSHPYASLPSTLSRKSTPGSLSSTSSCTRCSKRVFVVVFFSLSFLRHRNVKEGKGDGRCVDEILLMKPFQSRTKCR